MLRLPKDLQTNPNAEAILARFTASERPLRPGGAIIVSAWEYDTAIADALGQVYRHGHLVQGLEHCSALLDKEQKGLRALQEKTGQEILPRLSRLVFLANNGTERFYRDAESLLSRHVERLWGCCLDVNAEELGAKYTAKGQPAKLLMIDDRKAISAFLAAYAEGFLKNPAPQADVPLPAVFR